MAPKREEPTSVEEAQRYVGTELWKFWPQDRKYYHGRVAEIDTLLVNDEGTEEEGLFYKIEYDDEDSEHVLWEELARLLANNAKWNSKKRKNAGAPVGASNASPAATGDSPAASEQPAPSSKRRRKQQQELEVPDSEVEDEHGTDEVPDSADEEYDAQRAAKPANKRSKGKQQVPDSGTRNNSKQQQQRHGAAASPEASHERNDAAAAAARSDDAAVAEEAHALEQQEDFEEMSNAAAEQILREGINEVVTVRHQGLAGHIKSVQVQNFMCHQNFAIDLGTHVNVISGSNGSGKSAVLQAIQSCFGVRAKDTGRGDKMKDFVRTGCHDCKVQVTIWNTGEDAYKHREYGDTIIVERTIKITGAKETASSKVRLLSGTGRVVSQRQDELNAMKDHLNIDAGNALAVMTQDTSRSFLCGSVADKKKYELFMNATMLADMQAALKKAQGCVNEMKEIMKGIRDEHIKRQNRLKEVEQKLQKLEESEGLLGQRVMYERAVCWVAVEDLSQVIKQLKEKIEVEKPQIRANVQQQLEQIATQLDKLREEEETLAAAAESDQATQQNFASDVHQLAEDVKRARLEYRHKNSALQKLDLKLKQATAELNSLLESTRETNDDRQREFEEKLQQHQAKVGVEEQKMQAAEAAFRQREEELQQLSTREQQKSRELNDLQQRQQAAQTEFNNFQMELRHLQAAKGQKQAMFGTQHVTLRALVDRNRRSFDRVPVGPIGAHLTLTEEKWNVAAEVVLGGRLDSWIVHNSNDEKVLRNLAKNVKFHTINIIVADFNRPAYNLTGRVNINQGWTCLRQFVKVEHPEVPHIIDNKLMDLTRYEIAIVDEDEGRCKSAVYQQAAGPGVGTSVHIGGRSWGRTRAAVSARNYYHDRNPRLSQSFDASLQNCRRLMAEREAILRELHQALIVVNQELQRLKQESAAAMRASKTAKGNQMRAQAALHQIQAQAPVFDPIDEEDADDMLAEQKRTLQEQIQTLGISHDRAKTEAEQAHTAMEQASQLYNGRKQEMDEVISQLGSRQEEIDRLAKQKQDISADKNKMTAAMQKIDAETNTLKQELDTFTQRLELFRTAAMMTCDEETGVQALADARAQYKQRLTAQLEQRIASRNSKHAGMSPEDAQAMIETTYRQCCFEKAGAYFYKEVQIIERKIAAVEEDAGGSKEELQHQRDLAKAEFNRHYRTYEDCRKTLEATSVAVHKRWTKYYDLFDSISKTVSEKFHAYMHRRGHSGRVGVSSEDGEVRLMVKINSQAAGAEAKKMKAVRDLKQLSGGERSFTTVAFILALGQYTESPFRAMDEFDVFMDPINRRIATQTLLEFAREQGQWQFILLTPQDLQVVEDAKRQLAEGAKGKPLPEGFVKVVQMAAARPNQ